MRFDLFDAVKQMKGKLGDESRLIVSPVEHGIEVRLEVLFGKMSYMMAFIVPYSEITSDGSVDIVGLKWDESMASLVRLMKSKGVRRPSLEHNKR